MKTTKTLALAALAALSLGVGTALAQEGGENAFPWPPVQHVAPITSHGGVQVQSGSSDIDTAEVPRGRAAGQPLFRADGQGF